MYDRKRPVPIKDISREEEISGVYLEQIFNRLKNQGLVRSIRGPGGGYALVRDPSDISVYEVVMALEGSVNPVRCVSGKGEKKECGRIATCASKEVWREMARRIKETLGDFSLRDLAGRTLELDPGKARKAQLYEKSLS